MKNTVSANDQMRRSDVLRYYGNEDGKRVLILGNSITRHGPCPEIGWEHDWGMAASREENDYVHRLLSLCKGQVFLCVRQAAEWEVSLNEGRSCTEKLAPLRGFGAETVIFRLGENIRADIGEGFYPALKELIGAVAPPSAQVIFTTPFWKNEQVERGIERCAEERGVLVPLSDLGGAAQFCAVGEYAHEGICAHPNDAGMRAIAERIFRAM